ncbi:MAG: hypothetical protein AVO39_01645 [delta proteobacterium MLS_D]|jgi:heterodisulfide reductase subunit A2|nr:MAG: hypothetical protein AVO39_01645 [delta proteobacterium MLS_D]
MKNITVFLCTCFDEINRVVDYERLCSHLSDDPRVAAVTVSRGLCVSGGAGEIGASVKSGDGRVLIAACSPLARGDQVMRDLERAGVPAFRRHLVDLREGCAWIHGNNPAAATEKALDLLNMGLTALEYKEPSADVTLKIADEVLVIGAGPAGMAAATALARCGVDVRVLERGAQPGGMLGLVSRSYPDNTDPSEKIAAFRDLAASDPRITFHSKVKIISARGYAGNFTVRFTAEGEELQAHAGAVIIATGGRVFPPKGYYRYGEVREVVSQIELEARFRKGPVKKENAVFIQCVGARCEERPYCSTICCPASIKNAMRIMDENENARVWILHRDIMMPGTTLEAYYKKAMERGVRFIRYAESDPPRILGDEAVETVEVRDDITGDRRTIPADLVVLSTPLIAGTDAEAIGDLFGIQRDSYGFFREIYPLHPVETRIDGVYICGSARWPVSSEQAMVQGEAAAMKAAALVGRQTIRASEFSRVPGAKFGHARVNEDTCSGCGNCAAVCSFDAIRLQRRSGEGEFRMVSRVIKVRCKACGNCLSVCPNGSMQMPEMNTKALYGMVGKAFS